MWSKIAEEMAIPWRAAEAMHWQIGENDMARRAGVTPFSLTLTNNNSTSSSSTNGGGSMNGNHHTRSTHHRHNLSISRSSLPGSDGSDYASGRLLGSVTGQQQLPSLAELTAGLPAFHHPSIQPLLPTHHGLGLSSMPPGSSAAGNGSGGGGGNAYSYSHHGYHSRGHSLSHSGTRTPIPGTPYSSGLPYPGHGHTTGYAPHVLVPSPVRGGIGADFFLKRS